MYVNDVMYVIVHEEMIKKNQRNFPFKEVCIPWKKSGYEFTGLTASRM